MVYIADASIQISNTANVYKIVKSFSLEDAWIKGPAMILNSCSIMCEGLKEKVISLLPVLIYYLMRKVPIIILVSLIRVT